MEVRKLIGKPLQPARPIRRGDTGPPLMLHFQAEIMDSFKEDVKENYNVWCSLGKLNGLLQEAKIQESPKKSEKRATKPKAGRITYSRDDLLKMSSLSASRVKPKHLPDLPVVLQRPRSDLPTGPSSSTVFPV